MVLLPHPVTVDLRRLEEDRSDCFKSITAYIEPLIFAFRRSFDVVQAPAGPAESVSTEGRSHAPARSWSAARFALASSRWRSHLRLRHGTALFSHLLHATHTMVCSSWKYNEMVSKWLR
jgi:hypothetical protein